MSNKKVLERTKRRVDDSIALLKQTVESVAKDVGISQEHVEDYRHSRAIAALEDVSEDIADLLEDAQNE